MNKVILMGRLTADPTLNQTKSGLSSCRFTIAINRSYKNQNGTYDADFIGCVAWNQTADFICKYFKKGAMIAVEGTLRNNNYQDRKHPDVTHYAIDVNVDKAEFAGKKNDNANQNPQPQKNNSGNENYMSEFEEILANEETPF